MELKNLEEDILERQKYIKSMQDKKEFLAYVMWKILWIHPFFDYNGRVTRLF
ncbi:MAG: Fic family protein [bacterium]|nr:Fic family protein [bacterium]MDP3380015.1 Fic family protein [bacterium]